MPTWWDENDIQREEKVDEVCIKSIKYGHLGRKNEYAATSHKVNICFTKSIFRPLKFRITLKNCGNLIFTYYPDSRGITYIMLF